MWLTSLCDPIVRLHIKTWGSSSVQNSVSRPDWKVKDPDNQNGEDKCLSNQQDDVKGLLER